MQPSLWDQKKSWKYERTIQLNFLEDDRTKQMDLNEDGPPIMRAEIEAIVK